MEPQISEPHAAMDTAISGAGEQATPDDILDWEDFEADDQEIAGVESEESEESLEWLTGNEEPEAEFISQPEEAAEGSSEWSMPEAEAAQEAEDDLPDWLKSQVDEDRETADAPVSDLPDWLEGLADEPGPESEDDMDSVPDWLQQTVMASSPFQAESEDPAASVEETHLEEQAPEEPAGAADPVIQGDVPAWLMDIVNEEDDAAAGESAEEDLPDWLQQTMMASSPFKDPQPEEDSGAETVLETPDESDGEAPAQEMDPVAAADEDEYSWEQAPITEEELPELAEEGEPGIETMLEAPDISEIEPEMSADLKEEEDAVEEIGAGVAAAYEPADWEVDTSEFERPDIAAMQAEEARQQSGTETVLEEPEDSADESPAMPTESPGLPEPAAVPALATAREALQDGDVASALGHYQSLIRTRANLSEVIEDLNGALEYDHPVDIDIWATLGDAYAGNDNLQKALDAYTRAEELLK